ncbi:L,D-transpeptidase [Embleya sp. NBC_00896]|uniref:L,D-transpeptidase n=1 Tax=Embleya sp. NBC_00896 TaxID=2975961 RepID=UPI003864990B|nr:L,D-transpeptidase [Embleya sp. NBC_00896]
MNKTRISLAVTVTAILALSACNSGSSSDSTSAKAGAQSPLPETGSAAPVTPGPASSAPETSAAPTTSPSSSTPPTSAKPSSKPSSAKPSTSKPAAKPTTTKPPAAPAGLDQRCMTGRAICIDKRTDKLSWVIDGKVQYSTAVRFGSAETPTREGAFSINFKSRDHVSTLYHTPMPFAMFFSGGQAVHYSADFAANGYNGASHGCVNVRDKGLVQQLFNETRVGDKVIVYRSVKK